MCDIVEFSPKKYKRPTLSSAYTSARAALELSKVLKNLHPTKTFSPLNDNTLTAIKEISKIFLDTTKKPTALTTSANPRTTKLQRVIEPPQMVESRKAAEATRVEELHEEIITPIQTELWKQQLITHRYPT